MSHFKFYSALLLNNLVNKERENKDLFERNLKITDQLMEIQENKAELERELLQARLIKDDLKNKRINEIFEDDSRKFKYVARVYEISFYSIVIILILYFLGLTFYVNDFKFLFIEASFPEKIHGKLSPEFYIQKVSLGEFKHEVRQFQKPYDNQQAEQISLMV